MAQGKPLGPQKHLILHSRVLCGCKTFTLLKGRSRDLLEHVYGRMTGDISSFEHGHVARKCDVS